MGYLGGKFRVRWQISEYINALSPHIYLEPFCGYCWVGERVRAKTRLFSDVNQDIVLMWQALMKGWKPPTQVSEDEFQRVKHAEPSALRGFVRSACTFGCDMGNGGYARDKQGTNYALVRGRQLLRRVSSFVYNSTFTHADYRDALKHGRADVIYLDPPYANTVKYSMVDFDYDTFWEEVRRHSDGRRRILVSEYTAPKDFTEVLNAKSRMGMRVLSHDGLMLDERAELLFEYHPPKRSRVVFSSFLEADDEV